MVAAMSEADDLARRFFALWTEYLTALLSDPKAAAVLQGWLSLAGRSAWGWSRVPHQSDLGRGQTVSRVHEVRHLPLKGLGFPGGLLEGDDGRGVFVRQPLQLRHPERLLAALLDLRDGRIRLQPGRVA